MGKKEEQNNLMAMLGQQRLEAVDVQYTLEEQQKVIEGQDAAIQKAIELEQQRQAELKRQQEEEKKTTRRQKDNKKKQQNNNNAKQQQAPATTSTANTSSNKPAVYCFLKQLYSTNTRCCYIWFWLSNPPCVWY